ncbi:hypothetical protein SUGI_0928340 [Cryptomeria japonica]|uniref:uncharacterized protein LOC131029670 n=1 Tax=Cryptomeria japonica TaxID=3369 RepID=UPI002414A6AA|nr:uncharacterized protein LOC131029670 [Cryptomeria japonica]GLJ44334.1 hypothetical protein SUGI_0928340 [Cryptomeria japonica]
MAGMAIVMLFSLLLLDISNGFSSPALTPPAGNSLKMKLKTRNGIWAYKCEGSKWVPVLATADVVNASDLGQSYGNFSLLYRPSNPKFAGLWYLINGPADSAESGMTISIVGGTEIASEASAGGGIPEIVAEASYHKNYGVAYRVSYIQRVGTKGGIPSTKCSGSKKRLERVPFEAEFWFYTQDLVPPTVPAPIGVPSGRMVMGMFCKGVAKYNYDGSKWVRQSIQGKLYDVPGGIPTGKYYVKSKADPNGGTFCLETNNPLAWSVTGKIQGNSVQVSPDSIPWSLFQITSSSGNTSVLGPFNYFQMISTRGGAPPKASKGTAIGSVYKSLFTNVFWLFCPP